MVGVTICLAVYAKSLFTFIAVLVVSTPPEPKEALAFIYERSVKFPWRITDEN